MQKLRNLVSGLKLTPGASQQQFIKRVSETTGRKIAIFVKPLPIGIFGAWIRSEQVQVDNIYISNALSSRHQFQVIAHECGHILLRHNTLVLPTTDTFSGADLSKIMTRTTYLYTTEEEQLAEKFADMVLASVSYYELTRSTSKLNRGKQRALGLW